MKCFYCAEEIEDAARFCRHCRQELSLMRELVQENDLLQDRVASLEKQISGVTDSTDSFQQENSPSTEVSQQPNPQPNSIPSWKNVLVVFVAAISIGCMRLIDPTISSQNEHVVFGGELFVSATLAVPFGLGLWLGIKEPRRRLESHALLGILLGILLGLATVNFFLDPESLLGASINGSVTIFFVLITTPMFVSGAWIGRLISRPQSPSELETTAPETKMDRRLEVLGPAAIALIGTIFAALVNLLKG